MYQLKENGVISELASGNDFEYILQDNSLFANTDYKVLQNQNSGIFVKCVKMTRNGHVDLLYLTEAYRSLSSMVNGIDADKLLSIFVNLFADVIEVKNNGFLVCQSIDLSWDKIFVDNNTGKVKLIYLPLKEKAFDSYPEFETELRSRAIQLFNTLSIENNDRVQQFIHDLSDGSLAIEDVYAKNTNSDQRLAQAPKPAMQGMSSTEATGMIKLVAMNISEHFEIVIDGPDVVIGKKQELVNKVIPFNKMISRKHCRIINVNSDYFIIDEGSANGTFVNGTKLISGDKRLIKRGDVIRLADSDFQVI